MIKVLSKEKWQGALYSFIVVIVLWGAMAWILNLPIVPSPYRVFINIIEIFKSKIEIHVMYSLGRILAGIAISILVGVPLGYLMGYYNRIDKILSPLVYFTYPVPKLALLPVVMLLFGLGEISKLIMIVLIIVFQIIIASRDAVKGIPAETFRSLRSLGASKLQYITEIILPASLPEVLTSTRLALGTAVSILFFTETFGTEYGMGKASKIGKEWNEQADAFAAYVVGKTLDEVKGIAVNEEGIATAADLTSSVTIHIGDFVAAVEKAVNNAQDLGAKTGDKLGLGIETTMGQSADVAADKAGLAQAYSYYTVSTFGADGKITSSVIDASQGSVNFDATGKITSDIKAAVQTKDEIKEAYGMKKVSKLGKEWYEEAAAFAKYVTGKSVDEVKGIAVNEEGAATASDLTSSVTIGIGDFQKVIDKASANAK
jgi:ABC-type nitrate/sulfonate/bicarbonate transport system permease component